MARPLMAMAVGNIVEGDSRVEKAALTAKELGYDVYIVGERKRHVTTFDSYHRVPILRPTPDWSRYKEFRAALPKDTPDVEMEIDKALQTFREATENRRIAYSEHATRAFSLASLPRLLAPEFVPRQDIDAESLSKRLIDPTLKLQGDIYRRFVRAKANLQHWDQWLLSGLKNSWRTLWPQIADYEQHFLNVFKDLSPDIIHVHDRHAMSAAKEYKAQQKTAGRYVPWVYDAHEFLPGQRFGGPAGHRFGWLSVEAEMIRDADHVITVSSELAERLQRRHHLSELPSVVVNAPSSVRMKNPEPDRTSLRSELKLDSTVPLLVYVGKLAERRGIYTAVEAMRFLPEAHLAFVGSKDVEPRRVISELSAKYGVSDRVHIVDYVPSKNVTSYISDASVGLSPLYGTPAHHEALATKIREYLQAGLPIVGTDLRVQGKFIREAKVGAIHEERDPLSFSRAINEVLASLPEYADRVEKLRSEHSWEKQEEILAEIWGSLKPVAENQSDEVLLKELGSLGASAVTALPLREQRAVSPYLKLICLEDSRLVVVSQEHIYFSNGANGWLRLSEVPLDTTELLRLWSCILENAHAVILSDLWPFLDSIFGEESNVRASLEKSGIPLFVAINDEGLSDPFLTAQENPGSRWNELPDDRLLYIGRQAKRARLAIKNRGLVALSTHPSVLSHDIEAHWVPPEASRDLLVLRQDLRSFEKVRVGLLPVNRSRSEEALLEEIIGRMSSVEFVQINNNSTETVSLVIDSLTESFHSSSALTCLEKGIPVIGHLDSTLLCHLDFGPPIIQTTISEFELTLRGSLAEVMAFELKAEAAGYLSFLEEKRNLAFFGQETLTRSV